MKNLVFCTVAATLILASVTACSDEKGDTNNKVDNEKVEVIVHTGVATKAEDSMWDFGDRIGITMYDPAYENILEDQFNYEYITQRNLGIFNPVNVGETLYFPLNGSDMRLKSYYPYMANLPTDMIVHWSVASQASLPAIDLMTAEHVSGFNKESLLVRLHFYHRLSKLVFLLSTEAETSGVSLADCQLTIRGMETGNDYDLFNDAFLNNSDGIADIQVPLRTDEDANERMAIVLPRLAGEGVEFLFTTPGGDVYTAIMSDALELERGNKYIFYITLAENPTIITATIEPWIENDYEYLQAN